MAKQSLASQTGSLATTEIKMPSIFSAPPARVQGKKWPPYAIFAHPKRSDEWTKIRSKLGGEPQEGNLYLVDGDNVYSLNPGRVALLCCKEMWFRANGVGEVLEVSYEEMPDPFKQRVESVIVVYLQDRIVPATLTFKTTKCGGAKALTDELVAAGEPDWPSRSPQHKETLCCPSPWMRYVGEISVSSPRTSKSSGMTYRPCAVSCTPSGINEWKLVADFCKDPESQRVLESVAASYESRLAELDAKARK